MIHDYSQEIQVKVNKMYNVCSVVLYLSVLFGFLLKQDGGGRIYSRQPAVPSMATAAPSI